MTHTEIRAVVRENYARAAQSQSDTCCAPTCCTPAEEARTEAGSCCSTTEGYPEALGYTTDLLAQAPDEAVSLSLGCGNPHAIAALEPGETVLDLGSGGGLDCFLAAQQVGPSGRVIGVDMTPEMLDRARESAHKLNLSQVSFRLGEIEHLPIEDADVDVILSNCVINLSPEKPQVVAEMFRVLKPGGRIAISDVVATADIPQDVRQSLDQYVGCVSGAASVEDWQTMLEQVGFEEIRVDAKPESASVINSWFPGLQADQYVASAQISAIKKA